MEEKHIKIKREKMEIKTQKELLMKILDMHNQNVTMKIRLANYKIFMFMIYSLALSLFGFILIVLIVNGLP